MSQQAHFDAQTFVIATAAPMVEGINAPRFMSFSPYRAGWDRLARLLGTARDLGARSVSTTCDICLHGSRVPLARAKLVFATRACRDAWYAAPEDAGAPDILSRSSSRRTLVRDPHLEMHIDGRCLLRCFVGGSAIQVQSRHVFSLSSMVPGLLATQVA